MEEQYVLKLMNPFESRNYDIALRENAFVIKKEGEADFRGLEEILRQDPNPLAPDFELDGNGKPRLNEELIPGDIEKRSLNSYAEGTCSLEEVYETKRKREAGEAILAEDDYAIQMPVKEGEKVRICYALKPGYFKNFGESAREIFEFEFANYVTKKEQERLTGYKKLKDVKNYLARAVGKDKAAMQQTNKSQLISAQFDSAENMQAYVDGLKQSSPETLLRYVDEFQIILNAVLGFELGRRLNQQYDIVMEQAAASGMTSDQILQLGAVKSAIDQGYFVEPTASLMTPEEFKSDFKSTVEAYLAEVERQPMVARDIVRKVRTSADYRSRLVTDLTGSVDEAMRRIEGREYRRRTITLSIDGKDVDVETMRYSMDPELGQETLLGKRLVDALSWIIANSKGYKMPGQIVNDSSLVQPDAYHHAEILVTAAYFAHLFSENMMAKYSNEKAELAGKAIPIAEARLQEAKEAGRAGKAITDKEKTLQKWKIIQALAKDGEAVMPCDYYDMSFNKLFRGI